MYEHSIEKEDKYCIFHIPNKLDEHGMSGSQVRPRKMLQAFKDIGYTVDAVMGYGKERKSAIKKIEQNIKNGVKYDFLYSESSTMPTLLTEKKHLPVYPNLDFGFFSFCKRHGIPIGLFYRDIYWRFPLYKKNVKGLKYYVAQLAYRYDLMRYRQLLSRFYVPTAMVGKYIGVKELVERISELPPGAEYKSDVIASKCSYIQKLRDAKDNRISLFYVGGIGAQYKFEKLLKSIYDLEFVDLVICCREKEWEENKSRYEGNLTERVKIVHKSGVELEQFYDRATVCLAFFEQDEYMAMAMPVKIFEYMAHALPIIATNQTAAGEFVRENDIGWSIDYDEDILKNLLVRLHENNKELYKKHQNVIKKLEENTWISRAELVKKQLSEVFDDRRE